MKPTQIEAGRTVLNFIVPADLSASRNIRAGVNDLLTSSDWANEEVINVDLALQEALANAIRHGCNNDPRKQVRCYVTLDAGELVIVVSDPGLGFDMAAVPDPLESANLLKASGRGIFLMRELMDFVEFADGGRQVRMQKRQIPTLSRADDRFLSSAV